MHTYTYTYPHTSPHTHTHIYTNTYPPIQTHQYIQVILESDQVSLKILDYLNKRISTPSTSAFPLISSVLLLPQHHDKELLLSIENVGGANAVINLPQNTSDILR